MCNHYQVCEDRLRMREGTCLQYRIWIPKKLCGAIVLVHGAGENLETYKHLGTRFAQDGYALITFDLRGFGRSDGRSGHVTRFGQYLEDMDQLVRFFKRQLGNVGFYLIGHSLGGLIVTRYAQSYSETINGIILSAPALGLRFDIPHSANRMIQLISRVTPSLSFNPYRLMEKAQCIPKLKPYVSYNVEAKLKDPLVALRYSIRWVQELLVHINEAMNHAESITVPTLCMCGDNDPVIPPNAVRSFFDQLTVKDKEWLPVFGAGHGLLHLEQSTLAVNALIEWLKQRDMTHA